MHGLLLLVVLCVWCRCLLGGVIRKMIKCISSGFISYLCHTGIHIQAIYKKIYPATLSYFTLPLTSGIRSYSSIGSEKLFTLKQTNSKKGAYLTQVSSQFSVLSTESLMHIFHKKNVSIFSTKICSMVYVSASFPSGKNRNISILFSSTWKPSVRCT